MPMHGMPGGGGGGEDVWTSHGKVHISREEKEWIEEDTREQNRRKAAYDRGDCPECKGNGWVWGHGEPDHRGSTHKEKQKCSWCDGSGKR